MQMQTQLIAHLLSTRLTHNGEPQCVATIEGDYNTTARCTGGTAASHPERVVISFEHVHVGGWVALGGAEGRPTQNFPIMLRCRIVLRGTRRARRVTSYLVAVYAAVDTV